MSHHGPSKLTLQVDLLRSEGGMPLRPSAGQGDLSTRLIDARAKQLEGEYTNRSSGKQSDLNVALRKEGLSALGSKQEKCHRLAAHHVKSASE